MLQKTKEYILSKFREPDFKEHYGIFKAEPQLLEPIFVLAEQTLAELWKKQRQIDVENRVRIIWYDTFIEQFYIHPNQGYRVNQSPYILQVENVLLDDRPTISFRHPVRTYYFLRLIEQNKVLGSAQGKRIEQLYQCLDKKGIEYLSSAPFKNITEGLSSAPQRGDKASLAEALRLMSSRID